MEKINNIITEEQAYVRMARICSQKECCSYDIERKLQKMNLPVHAVKKVVERLQNEKFIDEDRFTRSFIHDKLHYNKWGSKKIEMALRQKKLPPGVIAAAFSAFSDASLNESLQLLLEKKWRSIKGRSEYEKKGKLIQYALGRGFPMKEILSCLKTMDIGELPDVTE